MTFEELGAKLNVTEWDTGWTASPDREMVVMGLVALLARVTLPFRAPAADGAKVTFSTAEFPAAKIRPEETPPVLTPAPDIATFETEMFVLPVFVRITGKMLPLPTVIFPKFRFVALALSCPATVTVSIAALLVTVPVEVPTTTENCDPLSEAVVAGVL